MKTSILLSISSILFGIIAWAIPILAIKRSETTRKKCYKFIIISFSSCVASLCLQFFEINYRVEIKDLAAIMDTIGTLKWVAVILSVVTIALNALALGVINELNEK